MKRCSNCKIEKNEDMFYRHRSNPQGLDYRCKDCAKDYAREWGEKNKGRRIGNDRERHKRHREAVFNKLGHVCCRCGFSDKRALQVDHINGGGNKEVNSFSSTKAYMKYLSDNADPDKYQILCANCNWIKKCENHEVGNYYEKKNL